MATILQIVSTKIRRSFITEDMIRDTLLFRTFIILAVLIIVLTLLAGYFFYGFPEVIVLRSNIYFGIDLIGAKSYSLAIPIVAFIVTLVHLAIARIIYAYNKEIARILILGTIIVILFLLVNYFFLINLNS